MLLSASPHTWSIMTRSRDLDICLLIILIPCPARPIVSFLLPPCSICHGLSSECVCCVCVCVCVHACVHARSCITVKTVIVIWQIKTGEILESNSYTFIELFYISKDVQRLVRSAKNARFLCTLFPIEKTVACQCHHVHRQNASISQSWCLDLFGRMALKHSNCKTAWASSPKICSWDSEERDLSFSKLHSSWSLLSCFHERDRFFSFFSPLQPMAAPLRPRNQWVSTIPLPSFPSFLKMHPPINPAGCISDGRRDLQKHLPKNRADLLWQSKQNCWINSPPPVRNPRSVFSYGNKDQSHHGCLPCKSLPWLFCDGDMFGVYDVVGKCPSPLDLTGWRRPSLLSEAASSDDRLFPASLLDGAFKTNGWSFQESH